MFRMYFKIALRNFVKEKFFSVINIAGLSVGIAVALLITLYLYNELTFENFHSKRDRIHRINMHLEVGASSSELRATFPPMARALEAEVPEVENAVRLYRQNGRIFKNEDKVFSEDNVLYADSAFFSVFDFEVLAGNPTTALAKPRQIMLTPELVKKYFNTENLQSVVGNDLLIDQEDFEVTGVVSAAPSNSHLKFTAIANLESIDPGRDRTWNSLNVSTYVLLQPQTSISSVVEKIPVLFKKYIPNYDAFATQGIVMQPFSAPLEDIHLKSTVRDEFVPVGTMMNVYIFGTVALIVLLLASVNFVNLLTARSANRAKEVGVRKVLGSARANLVSQFIFECVLLVGVATLLALGIVELIRTPFAFLSGKVLPFDQLLSVQYLGILTVFILFLGILAGSYPAFFLSSFQPAQVLKGKIRSGFKSSRLRNTLVTLQFFISIVLITCTLVMQHQLDFMRSKKLGFDKDNVLVLDNADRLKNQQSFINELEGLTSIESVGAASSRSIDDYDGMVIMTSPAQNDRQEITYSRIDAQYMDVLKYEFIEGRNFSKDIASDSVGVVINESAAAQLYAGDAMGKKLYNDYEYTVIGVVKDFNFESLKHEVRPVVFYNNAAQRYLHIRIKPGDYTTTLASIESLWKQQTADVPFSYAFLDDTYSNLYKEEGRLGTLFTIFTGIGLFIACLGLIGLTAYMAEQKKKEISVRKVLGATISQIVLLLSKDFARILIIAFVIALPLSWYLMEQWLANFIYRTEVTVNILLIGGGAVILTAFVAISYQAVRAALVNPVESLKEE